MANAADHVTLSTGQILFADPSLPWTPANFPNLPPTALSLTAAGTIAGRDINKLTLPNVITYANYESAPLRPGLIKSLVVNAAGDVAYDDPKVSLVSTTLSAYNVGITGFGSPAIGAPGITNAPPDTLTNAVAKLDGWITQNLLSQPPAVNPVETENTSLYAGVRWNNYPVYNVFQYSVPNTTGIVLILGDPTTSDFLTLELTNVSWFPDRQYIDGLASDFNPIVRLRIFNEFFLTNADAIYSKAYMQASCVKIIGESGIYTLPSTGKVFAIQNSVAGETYTTINLYLPQIPTSAQIPVRIAYINKTQTSPNVALSFISTTTFGAPSAPTAANQFVSSPASFTLNVELPIFSDATHNVSSCYFSSYNVQYTVSRMNNAHSSGLGFRYGQASPNTLPSYLSSYINSTLTQAFPIECGTSQNLIVSGSGNSSVLPGLQWSTSIYATNSAQLIGSTLAGPDPTISAFPSSIAKNISSASIQITSPWAVPSGSNGLAYLNYGSDGWNIGLPLSTNTLFLSSPQLTNYQINTPIQFNDYSYPGCRSNMEIGSVFRDIDDAPQSNALTINSVSNDFVLNSNFGTMTNDGHLSTFLTESANDPAYQKFFYLANITGAQVISTISESPQSLVIDLKNFAIDGYNTPIYEQTLSTNYIFQTEPASTFAVSSFNLLNTVTELVQISGLYSPTAASKFAFNLNASNFINKYANYSSIVMAQMYFNNNPAGPLTSLTSSMRIFQDATEITTLPFPGNVVLTLSSCCIQLTSNIYQDPADPQNFDMYASVTPANPVAPRGLNSYMLGSTLFVDTTSANLFSTFTNINNPNGLRVLSLVPRYEDPGSVNNMNDGVNEFGETSNGLDVSVSSFFIMGLTNTLTISSSVVYNHTSSISSIYTDPYSRELIFTNGKFSHPGGFDFTQFNGVQLGVPTASYPNFINDLSNDNNYGNRYASFLWSAESNAEPIGYQFVNIRVRNPSAISTITAGRTYNFAFPDQPVPDYNMEFSKVRMHLKILGAYTAGVYTEIETAWINCLKQIDYGIFDDEVYDIGGCVAVSTAGADVWYKVQMGRRFFTSIYPIVRVGISRDGSAQQLPAGSEFVPISFENLNVSISDA